MNAPAVARDSASSGLHSKQCFVQSRNIEGTHYPSYFVERHEKYTGCGSSLNFQKGKKFIRHLLAFDLYTASLDSMQFQYLGERLMDHGNPGNYVLADHI